MRDVCFNDSRGYSGSHRDGVEDHYYLSAELNYVMVVLNGQGGTLTRLRPYRTSIKYRSPFKRFLGRFAGMGLVSILFKEVPPYDGEESHISTENRQSMTCICMRR